MFPTINGLFIRVSRFQTFGFEFLQKPTPIQISVYLYITPVSIATAGTAGLEPATYWLTASCSTIELRSQISKRRDGFEPTWGVIPGVLQTPPFDHSGTYAFNIQWVG